MKDINQIVRAQEGVMSANFHKICYNLNVRGLD